LNVPFDDHVGPGLQFDGALFGQDPPRSLEKTKSEKYTRVPGDNTAHPPVIKCTPPCEP